MNKKLEDGSYILPIGKLTDKRFKDGELTSKLKDRLKVDFPLVGHIGHPDQIESFFGRVIPDIEIISYDENNNECNFKFVKQTISDETLKYCYLSPVITYKPTDVGYMIENIVTLDIILDHTLVNREIKIG